MNAQTWGRTILGFSIATTVLIVAVADVFNTTHLFNPAWPPHARFHNAMQAWTLLLVSAVSFAALLRGRFGVATIAPATFWPSLWLSLPVPGRRSTRRTRWPKRAFRSTSSSPRSGWP